MRPDVTETNSSAMKSKYAAVETEPFAATAKMKSAAQIGRSIATAVKSAAEASQDEVAIVDEIKRAESDESAGHNLVADVEEGSRPDDDSERREPHGGRQMLWGK
jgi:prophage DNA circulation protein